MNSLDPPISSSETYSPKHAAAFITMGTQLVGVVSFAKMKKIGEAWLISGSRGRS